MSNSSKVSPSITACERKIGPYQCCSEVQGDCLELMKALPDGCLGATVTSPPYNQLSSLLRPPTGTWGKTSGGRGFVEKWQNFGYEDDLLESDYQQMQNDLFAETSRATRDGGSLFYNHQIRWRDGVLIHPIQWFTPNGWNLRQEIVWDRGGGMMFNARMFCRYDERVLWFVRGDSWTWNQDAVGWGTIWRIAIEQNKEHPVAFPDEIPHRCVSAATLEKDIVFDPFCGSGTTLVAAKKLGRHFLGFEISPEYCQIARDRLARIDAQPSLFQPKPEQMSL